MTGRTKPRILVVYQYIALYRFPVFTEMARSEHFDFVFMAGTTGPGETARFAGAEELEAADFEWLPAQNHWLGKGLLWQSGVMGAVLSPDVDGTVFLGDMHYLSTWTGVVASKLIGKPVFFWTIGMHHPETGLKLLVRKVYHSIASHIFVYGDYARGLMREAGMPDDRMTTVGNSLDHPQQQRLLDVIRQAPPPASETPTVIAIGRLTARRRLDLMIEAVSRLIAQGRPLQAKLIGDGPERASLERLAGDLGISDRVEFLGAIYDEEVIASHAYAAEICVVPGIIGLGAVHAHSYGVPVITCGDMSIQAPEAEVIVPGVTGSFCGRDDVDSVVHKLRTWLDAGHDRAAVRQSCLDAIEAKWTPSKQREAFERVLARYLPAAPA